MAFIASLIRVLLIIPALYRLSTSSSFDEPEQRHAIALVLLVLAAVLRVVVAVVVVPVVAVERRSGVRAG